MSDLTIAGQSMGDSIERRLKAALNQGLGFGQIWIEPHPGVFIVTHRDDRGRKDLRVFDDPEDAEMLARFDDAGKYRPLRTAPNLRHGWRLELGGLSHLKLALEHFYPGRLAVLVGWEENRIATISLRETLGRQTGMYRVAANITDEQIDRVAANFCRSDGGCLRTILWKRDSSGTVASTKLPVEKFDPAYDQMRALVGPDSSASVRLRRDTPNPATTAMPLLCQEACNLLVNECRKAVKEGDLRRS